MSSAQTPKLTKFDLDFPGGTPDQLVMAIQQALGRPLNAIVPAEFAKMHLPPYKMRSVDASQFFGAMFEASHRFENDFDPRYGGRTFEVGFGFKTEGHPSDDSVWHFFTLVPVSPPPRQLLCNYYLLAPYLDKGLSVDDITTAIQTGWKMLADSERDELRYHPETKLLIVVTDDQRHTSVVNNALAALDHWRPGKEPAAADTKAEGGTK